MKGFILSIACMAAAGAVEDDPLAELAALGDALTESGPEAGGSIRAKRDVDVAKETRQKDAANLEAKVLSVKAGKFPAVALRVQVIKPAQSGKGSEVKKNDTLVVLPALKLQNGSIMASDAESVLNAGAYYLQANDKILLRLGEPKGKAWSATYIERK